VVRGASISFHIAAQAGKTYTAKIARASSVLDPQSRTMMVELDAYNKDGTLAPGMYPSVDWPVSSAEPLLLVPSTSVVSTTERAFVITSVNGHACWVDVRKGAAFGEQVAIRGNIKQGESRVCVDAGFGFLIRMLNIFFLAVERLFAGGFTKSRRFSVVFLW
jgi:multidrug efflux pump subunit AcrA (membrane-fusion protein)